MNRGWYDIDLRDGRIKGSLPFRNNTPGTRQTVAIVGIISDLIVLYRLFFGVFADRPREYNQGSNKLVQHTSYIT